MEQRLQQFQASAQQDIQLKQQELIAPVQAKAYEALTNLGQANGFIYIFDISTGSVGYFNEKMSVDVSEMLKNALNIPLDKKMRQPAAQQ